MTDVRKFSLRFKVGDIVCVRNYTPFVDGLILDIIVLDSTPDNDVVALVLFELKTNKIKRRIVGVTEGALDMSYTLISGAAYA